MSQLPYHYQMVLKYISGDSKWTYNAVTRTITWTMTNVPVGDPYLYKTGKNINRLYVFDSNISLETYNLNTEGAAPITINTANNPNPVIPTVNAVTTTIPMQQYRFTNNWINTSDSDGYWQNINTKKK